MLLKALAITWWLWLSSCRGDMYANVKYVVVTNVTVTKQGCVYKNHTFKDKMDANDTCEERTCYYNQKEVLLTSCLDPNPGCTRLHSNNTKIPWCCQETCYATSACTLPNGVLIKDGESFNYTDPCVIYRCYNGNLTIEEACIAAGDKRCQRSFANESAPYPACCGATACAG
uniref:8.9 kDa family member n=1 Tax=Rhipicephalus zambeziensis TaxID=60191 RepID=A0A224Y3K1_9ACAR